jgi:2-dehydropantoate 2-reductase
MRYVIIGAGAIGGVLGARLHDTGHDTVLVARGANAAALREHGLTLATPTGTTVHQIPVIDRVTEIRPDDVLVLAVKTQHTIAALDALPLTEDTPVLCAQNGVENERIALRRFANVYGMCTIIPATHLSPGVVIAPCAPHSGAAVVGRCPSGKDTVADRIAADLDESGLPAIADPDVMAWKYAKLINNIPNAVEALIHPDDADAAADLAKAIQAEADTVLAAAGIHRVSDDILAQFRAGRVVPQDVPGYAAGNSTWQSLIRGTGTVETDYFNGEITLLGRQHVIPTPLNTAIQHATHAAARDNRAPNTLALSELRSALLN